MVDLRKAGDGKKGKGGRCRRRKMERHTIFVAKAARDGRDGSHCFPTHFHTKGD